MKKLLIPVLLVALLGCATRQEKVVEQKEKARKSKQSLASAWHKAGAEQNEAEVWYRKGVALRGNFRYEEEIKAYDKAIELKPDYADAWYNKGVALRELGRLLEAEKAFEKAEYFEEW